MLIREGDRVAYSRAFYRSIGVVTGEVPFMRGKVLRLEHWGAGSDVAVIRWEGEPGTAKVNVSNLWPANQLWKEPN